MRPLMLFDTWKQGTREVKLSSVWNKELTTRKNEMTLDNSQRAAAKVAGVAGLLTFAIVVFGNYILLNPLIVPRNAADTARNILAHQMQFRVALTCFIAYGIGSIALLSALYMILVPADRTLDLIGALVRLVFANLPLFAPLTALRRVGLPG